MLYYYYSITQNTPTCNEHDFLSSKEICFNMK